MKSNLTKRRIKAQKKSSCAMCKPWKKGWTDKRTINDIKQAVNAEQQFSELL